MSQVNPWVFGDGVISINGGGGAYADADGLACTTTNLARRAMANLVEVMERLLERVRAVVVALQ